MKRLLWMVLIFTLLFSLTGVFAQQEVSVAKTTDEASVTVEKSSKKVSNVRKSYVRYNQKQILPEKAATKVPQMNSDNNKSQPNSSKITQKATQKTKVNKKANLAKKNYRKPYVKKKGMVNSKKIKSVTVEAVTTEE